MNQTIKSFSLKKSQCEDSVVIIDATNEVLGRLASRVAIILKGKDDPEYSKNMPGKRVKIINAQNIIVTGDKIKQKNYYSHSGYAGGLKIKKFSPIMGIEHAVAGMLPKGPLGRRLIRRLFVIEGEK